MSDANGVTTDGDGIVEAVLPMSGQILQWREADASYRELPERDAADDIGWHPWTGSPDLTLRADGDVWSSPSWLVVCGEMPQSGQVEVLQADDTVVPVIVVGRAWFCEWVGQGEPVTVRYGGDFPMTMRARRPESLGG